MFAKHWLRTDSENGDNLVKGWFGIILAKWEHGPESERFSAESDKRFDLSLSVSQNKMVTCIFKQNIKNNVHTKRYTQPGCIWGTGNCKLQVACLGQLKEMGNVVINKDGKS